MKFFKNINYKFYLYCLKKILTYSLIVLLFFAAIVLLFNAVYYIGVYYWKLLTLYNNIWWHMLIVFSTIALIIGASFAVSEIKDELENNKI